MPSGQIMKFATYRAVYRLASRPYALSNAFGAAGRKQFATLYHASTSLFKLQLRAVYAALESASAVSIIVADVVALTSAVTPATGNPAITPVAVDPREPADTDTVCLALPTTGGTEGNVISSVEWELGVTGAASGTNPPPALQYINLLDPSNSGYIIDPLAQLPTVRPLTAEGFAIILDVSAATTIKGFVVIEYTRVTQVGAQG